MKARITALTIGLDDLQRSRAFYRAGSVLHERQVGQELEQGAVVFFGLEGGLELALWPRTGRSGR